jgi:hypothetical protein
VTGVPVGLMIRRSAPMDLVPAVKVPVGLAAMRGCSSSRSDDWPGRPTANSAENQDRGSGRFGRDGGTAASSRVVKMSSWLTVGEGVLAASISVVGLVFTFSSNRRAQYDRVLKLTAESGVPPIAEDRHVIGLVFEPQSKLPANRAVTLSEHEIAALFRVLWYFQRVDPLYKSLQPTIVGRKDHGLAGAHPRFARPSIGHLGKIHRIQTD